MTDITPEKLELLLKKAFEDGIQAERLRANNDAVADRKAASSKRADTTRKMLAIGDVPTANGPSWLTLVDRTWHFVPEKVLVVEQIFAMATRGLSAAVIAGYLRDTGVKTLVRAEEWTDSSVNALIQNVAVLGHMQGRDLKAAPMQLFCYPPIIQNDVFELIKKHIGGRKGGRGTTTAAVPNLFSGLVKCQCGKQLKYFRAGGRVRPFMLCNASYDGAKCNAERIPYQPFEDQLMAWICEEHQFDMSVNRLVSYDPARPLELDLEDKKRRLADKQKARARGLLVGLNFQADMNALVEEIYKLETKIDELPLRFLKTGSQETKQLWDRYNAASGDMKIIYRLRLQAAVKVIISEIQVSTKSKMVNGEMVQKLKIFGPVLKLLYADHSEVSEFDQRDASRKFIDDGVPFEVRLKS